MNNKNPKVIRVQTNLLYAQEEIEAAENHASDIKDPELTKRLQASKAEIIKTRDYIKSRTNGQIG